MGNYYISMDTLLISIISNFLCNSLISMSPFLVSMGIIIIYLLIFFPSVGFFIFLLKKYETKIFLNALYSILLLGNKIAIPIHLVYEKLRSKKFYYIDIE